MATMEINPMFIADAETPNETKNAKFQDARSHDNTVTDVDTVMGKATHLLKLEKTTKQVGPSNPSFEIDNKQLEERDE